MAAEEVTEARLPFGMGKIDFSNPMMAALTIITLISGFAVFSMTQDVGSYVASRINNALAGVLGFNPATGEDNEGVPGV